MCLRQVVAPCIGSWAMRAAAAAAPAGHHTVASQGKRATRIKQTFTNDLTRGSIC